MTALHEDAHSSRESNGVPPHWAAHWTHAFEEAAELGVFVFVACALTLLLFHPSSAVVQHVPSALLRRALMGGLMGLTAAGIMESPFGRSSGAHFNPAVTLAFLRLGKISREDACLYIAGQFAGGIAGVLLAAAIFGSPLAHPAVAYAVTVPGKFGVVAAFAAELTMAFVLLAVLLRASNSRQLNRFTPLLAGSLITFYIFFFAPVSGFSINPARTVASGLVSGVWTALWIYLLAPTLGMIGAAEQYVRSRGPEHVYCAKLRHDRNRPCHFNCRFPQLLAGE